MKPLKYYEIKEVNREIIFRHKSFTPRGMCKFRAELEYKFGDLVITRILENDHRIPVKKFVLWAKTELNKIDNEFYSKVEAMRLEALLEGNEALHKKLMELPTEGSFTAYVVS